MTKYDVMYNRKISTGPYENMTIGTTMEFDTDDVKPNVGFQIVRALVESWIDIGAKSLEGS